MHFPRLLVFGGGCFSFLITFTVRQGSEVLSVVIGAVIQEEVTRLKFPQRASTHLSYSFKEELK